MTKENKTRLLLLDVIWGTGLQEVYCDTLNDFYKALKCECFDITNREIKGKRFDIFVDDIGLFAEHPIPSALNSDMEPVLVGNLVFANHDMEGNTISLSDDDIAYIKKWSLTLVDFDNMTRWDAICPVDP